MQCFGMVGGFRRCKNNARFLACSRHKLQIIIFILITIPGIIATYIAFGGFVYRLCDGWINKKETSLIESLGYSNSDVEAIYPMDLAKKVGAVYIAGMCPRMPCFQFQYQGIDEVEGSKFANIAIAGEWEGMKIDDFDSYIFGVPMERGFAVLLTSYTYDIIFEILDDRISSIKGTITVLKGTNTNNSGFGIRTVKCP